jgi:SAM-dependent methyltransferase
MVAPARIQEMQFPPAGDTKPVILGNHPRTSRTPGWQHEIKHGPGKFNENCHFAVVGVRLHRHKCEMSASPTEVPEIFDRNTRRLRRGRVKGGGFFAEHMTHDLLERLDAVNRDFKAALLVGAEPALLHGLAARGIETKICDPSPRRAAWATDEDSIDHLPVSFDLILSSGTLDTVNDLPGALVLFRRLLKPDGLLLANFAGAPTLTALRQVVATADAEAGVTVARFHPQIDVRSAGDLLTRAGFALPVADIDTFEVAYSSLARLLSDLREASSTNMLKKRYHIARRWLAHVDAAFAARAGPGGKTCETVSCITLTAWAPGPDQPKPARRGSGQASLAALLDKGND